MTSNNITALISKFWENAYIVTSTIPAYMQTIWVRDNYINTYIENFGIFNKRHQRAPAVPTNAGSAQGHWFIQIRFKARPSGSTSWVECGNYNWNSRNRIQIKHKSKLMI